VPGTPEIPDHITPAALAEKLGVSPRTVRRMIAAKVLPVVGLTGRTARIPMSAVLEYLAARTVPATTGEKR
jgi:excisionase family DNA binding protein